MATSKNIKSDHVRHAVEENLERCIQRLRNVNRGGLALFSGNEHLYEIRAENIPWYYQCSRSFQTQILGGLLDSTKEVTGIIAMDIEQCAFGYLVGSQLVKLKEISSGIAGKHSKGGQSQRRYERQREMFRNDYFNRIAGYAREYFLDNKRVNKLVIHGESFTKKLFLKENYLEYRLQQQAITTDGCYAGEDGLYEVKNLLAQP